MKRSIRLSAITLVVIAILVISRTGNQSRASAQTLLLPEAQVEHRATAVRSQEKEVGKVKVDLERDCKQDRIEKDELVSIPEGYIFSKCVAVEHDRKPTDREEINGWKCEWDEMEKKVRVTYWCDKHHECGIVPKEQEQKSILKVDIQVMANKKSDQSPTARLD